MADTVIETHELVRRFGAVTAVDGLSFEVERGEVFGFLGHNGAGKTTTVRLLNGVLTPTAGTLRVLGLDPVTQGPELRRRTGVLTESPSLDERLSAYENLSIYADLYGVPEAEVPARVGSLLERFELAERAGDKVGGYSKGMKQRMALARALVHRPELLFLDEPTAGLDPVAARDVHRLIIHSSRDEGHTVFLCTHNLVEAQRLCHRVAVLEHGKVLALGTPAELGRRYAHTQRLEIEVSPPTLQAALDELGRMLGIHDVVTENGTVQFSGIGHDAIPELIAQLVAAGVRLHRVTPLEPTLEDVYFALHGDGEPVAEEVRA